MKMQSFALAIALAMSSSFALAQSSGMGVSVLPPGAQIKPKAEEPKTTGSAIRSDNPTNAVTDNRVKKQRATPASRAAPRNRKARHCADQVKRTRHSPATNGSANARPITGSVACAPRNDGSQQKRPPQITRAFLSLRFLRLRPDALQQLQKLCRFFRNRFGRWFGWEGYHFRHR